MRSFVSHLALGACLAVMAAHKDQGHAALDPKAADKSAETSSAASADPVVKSDPAPHPLPADQVVPAPAHAEPDGAAVGLAAGADVNAPTNLDDAEHPKKGRVAVVWAQPGHEMVAIGALLSVPEDEAEALRAAGRARFASEAEVEAGGDAIVELSGI
ncbi:hypothetical protein [Caulobacter sp. UNC279MFTsu5.1]|uniref:hypothetical protein n=1 Tax=Caulobacter sp. UNC279MFTsu5.1 TaxID=1502775 RepID=UPI00036B7488|nr:hypothetical protein [Caulobacter sp. UNC279MFTsu5.1]SFK41713.1 hypothetical protein SAMN02799626_04238 [Caulobacter sp. UNC279MFTsu5.1]